jgi:Tfp pilus assembly protein PilX
MKNIITKKTLQNQEGQIALFIVFVIMTLLLFIALFLTNSVIKQTRVTRNNIDSIQAYYLADMGAERVLWGLAATGGDLNINNFLNENENVHNQFINNLTGPSTPSGSYQAIRTLPLGTLNIKISGVYKETSRAIELSWN